MIKKATILLTILMSVTWCTAQTISGRVSSSTNQVINLHGFKGFESYTIGSAVTDNSGNFKLGYSVTDHGMGYLTDSDNKPLYVVINGENIYLVGEQLGHPETIIIKKGKENQWLKQYSEENPRREQALSAWEYLDERYSLDTLFSVHKTPNMAIKVEKRRIYAENAAFLAKLPQKSYLRWFIPTRKLVSSAPEVLKSRRHELHNTIKAFRALDYADEWLYKSGFLKDAIESHFMLLESSGRPMDSINVDMQRSINAMLLHLLKDQEKLNEVTTYLFDMLERHSIFTASEYLAIKVLNETSCTINSNLTKQLETYRIMKKGNTAPDIVFSGDNYSSTYDTSSFPKKLSDIKSKYTVIVFGASWCPKCTQELPEMAKYYSKWKAKDIEVVFVSLDEDQAAYRKFAKDLPFVSTCDLKKWASPIANDYYVIGTPTMYLLDDQRKILLRPNSVKQMDAWVDWFLIEGNK